MRAQIIRIVHLRHLEAACFIQMRKRHAKTHIAHMPNVKFFVCVGRRIFNHYPLPFSKIISAKQRGFFKCRK